MALAALAKTAAAATARSMAPWLATSRRVPSGFVLERFVDLEAPPERLQEEWALVPCSSRKAYGCGEHGQKVVGGLTVYARLITSPDLTSALYIHADDDALRAIKAEFGCDCIIEGPHILKDTNHWFQAVASVRQTDGRFIFFTLHFLLTNYGERQYYLIYDSVDASLLMIPWLPKHCPVEYTMVPLHVPLRAVGGYELLLLARRPVPMTPELLELCNNPTREVLELCNEDVVCMWTPSVPVEDECPWKMLRRRFPEQLIQHSGYFAAELMFSFGGKAFWVDLRQGIKHCDWPPAAGAEVVDFGFIDLPPGCPPDLRWTKDVLDDSDYGSMTIHRTAACVNGGTIRFVYINRPHTGGSDNVVVSVWDMDLVTRVWKNCKTFLAKELWRLWSFKKEGLPQMEPRFPVLMADGTLCLIMRNKPKTRNDPTEEDYICNVELSNLAVLWSARLQRYHTCLGPTILPSHFFGTLISLDPLKPELRGIFTKNNDRS